MPPNHRSRRIFIMKSIKSILLLLAILGTYTMQAQTYNTAAGVRLGGGFDLTFQQYIKDHWTVEGILHTNMLSKNTGISVLAEKHRKVLVRNFGVYYGAGVHYYARKDENRVEPTVITKNVYGLSGIAGAEVSFGRLNFAVDVKPEIHLAGDQVHPFEWNPIAVSIRYIIDKRERRKVKDWKVWDKIRN